MWARFSLRTRSPVVPIYLPVDMVTSERQAPFQPESIRGQVMQHMCQDGCASAAPRLTHPSRGRSSVGGLLAMSVGCVATRALLAGSARTAALQGCSRPRIPSVCLCLCLYLFDCPSSESSGRRARTRSVHITSAAARHGSL
jgi:hypothetical protein